MANENRLQIQFQPIQTLIERRKEAREMGRLIYPEPFIAEIRKKRKLKIEIKANTPITILVKRFGDFIEGVARMIRDPENWESAVASQIIGTIVSKIIKI